MSGPIAGLDARAEEREAHADGVRAMFDRIAPTYDRLNRVLSGGIDVAWRRRAVRALRGMPSGPILDLCAGTMDLTAMVAKAHPDARVIAETTMIGMSARCLIRAATDSPSICGIIRSSSTRSGHATLSRVSASAPLCAVETSNPSVLSRSPRKLR